MKYQIGAKLPEGLPENLPAQFINTFEEYKFLRNPEFYSWGAMDDRPGMFVKHDNLGKSGCVQNIKSSPKIV